MEFLHQVKKILDGRRNAHIERAKAQGRAIIGYTCRFLPAELLDAVGAVPFRLTPTAQSCDLEANTFYSTCNCTFCRHAIGDLLQHEYDFLDGVVVSPCCDHLKRFHDILKQEAARSSSPGLFLDYFELPYHKDGAGIDWTEKELARIQGRLAARLGRSSDESKLRASIKKYNELRARLEELSRWRSKPASPLLSSQYIAVVLASAVIPVDDALMLTRTALGNLSNARPSDVARSSRARLMLVGGEMDLPRLFSLVESIGASVAAEFLCHATHVRASLVDEHVAPMRALAAHCVANSNCPAMSRDPSVRREHIFETIQRERIDGLVVVRPQNCDTWGGESFILKEEAKKRGVRNLELVADYLLTSFGQIQTRLQAFIESMEGN